nr:retrovirus-related Pol polyprotein from transposon TNT 1-94 [Tanacetum cinerariifolium]
MGRRFGSASTILAGYKFVLCQRFVILAQQFVLFGSGFGLGNEPLAVWFLGSGLVEFLPSGLLALVAVYHSGLFTKRTSAGKDNGENILKSIDEGPFQMGKFRETLDEGTEGALHLGLPKEIYTLINHYTNAKDIWDNVEMLLEGFELTKDDRESQLYDEFEHFRQNKGETIHDYNVRFTKLINAIKNIKMTIPKMQLNSKFVNNMLPEWAQENGMVLDEEQLLFIAGGQDNAFDDDVDEPPVQDLALTMDNIFQADQCDAFDSNVDEAPTTQTMFMENISLADLIYKEAGLSYDSYILSEVQDHDDYIDNIIEYHEVHEMQNDVQPNYVVDSDAEYTSDNNIIPHKQYVKDNAEQAVQSSASSIPNDALMMIINDIYEQVLHPSSLETIIQSSSNIIDRAVAEFLQFINAHQAILVVFILIDESSWIGVSSVSFFAFEIGSVHVGSKAFFDSEISQLSLNQKKQHIFNILIAKPLEIVILEIIELVIISTHSYPIQMLVVMAFDDLMFGDSDYSTFRVDISSRLPVDRKSIEVLMFAPQ